MVSKRVFSEKVYGIWQHKPVSHSIHEIEVYIAYIIFSLDVNRKHCVIAYANFPIHMNRSDWEITRCLIFLLPFHGNCFRSGTF